MYRISSPDRTLNPDTQNVCSSTSTDQTKFTSINKNFNISGEEEYVNAKRGLELLEERNRIRHKNVLFYILTLILISLLVGTYFLIKFGFYFSAVLTGSLFIIIVGILIAYFIRENDPNSEHTILNRFFDFASDILNLARRV